MAKFIFLFGIAVMHFLALYPVSVRSSGDFLVCKPIGDLFDVQQLAAGNKTRNLVGPPGPPGKKGPPGSPGPIGPVGPSGKPVAINWTEIDQRIQKAIDERSKCPGVLFNKSCFWLPQTSTFIKEGNGKAAAQRKCNFYNGTLVDVESEEMYDTLYKYLQRAWNTYLDQHLNYFSVWLASTYQNEQVISARGGTIYMRWYSGYPRIGSSLIWEIGLDSAKTVGIWNSGPNYNVPVAFCKLAIEDL